MTAPDEWRLDSPMTAFRMRHANGMQELLAQMGRHFFAQPPQLHAQQQQQQQPVQQQQQPEQAWAQQATEQRLERLAAAQATLASAFDAAGADGRDPVAAVDAAAEAGSLNASNGGPLAAGAPAPEAGQLALTPQEEQELEQRRFEAFTYLSQLQQALAYQAAIHQWRRNKGNPAALVRGWWGKGGQGSSGLVLSGCKRSVVGSPRCGCPAAPVLHLYCHVLPCRTAMYF